MSTAAAPTLSMWVVYYRPADLDVVWAARRWDITAGRVEATHHLLTSTSYNQLVDLVHEAAGEDLYRLDPDVDDDPCIKEIYL
jgi:hypothetical protein